MLFRRLSVLALCVVILVAASPAHSAESLAGKLLVAEPDLLDPNFSKTVVLIIRHDENGALGLVLNRRAEERSLSDLLALFGESKVPNDSSVALHFGGPVALTSSLALHDGDFSTTRTDPVGDDIAVSPTVDALKGVASGNGPIRVRVYFGYAGWSPGQLEGELAAGAWAVIGIDLDLVFADAPKEVWSRARTRIRLDL